MSYADIRPEKVFVADDKKTKSYVQDGLIIGGDRAIEDVIIQGIRRSDNPDFERIVIDLEGTRNGSASAIPRPPYYQVAISPDEKKLIISIWGHPQLRFDSKKLLQAFHKSSTVRNIVLMPRLEDDSWTFVIELKNKTAIELFELSGNARMILDIQKKRDSRPHEKAQEKA